MKKNKKERERGEQGEKRRRSEKEGKQERRKCKHYNKIKRRKGNMKKKWEEKISKATEKMWNK